MMGKSCHVMFYGERGMGGEDPIVVVVTISAVST